VISLNLPGDRRFFAIARFVVGALSTRLELSYEQMDDLQLAVETALRDHGLSRSTVTLEIVVEPERLQLLVGPVTESPEADDSTADLTPRRVLGSLVETVEVVERDGTSWIRLEEPIANGPARLGAS
jgi:hypothetical protein